MKPDEPSAVEVEATGGGVGEGVWYCVAVLIGFVYLFEGEA